MSSKPNSLEYKVSFNLNREMMRRIQQLTKATGLEEAFVLRSLCRAGLPLLEDIIGLIPMLQPGVFKTSDRKEYIENKLDS